MSITWKAALILLAMMLAMTGAVYLVSRSLVLDAFVGVERQDVQAHVHRIEEALNAELEGLVKLTGDWSNWDDVYEFVQDGNEEFISTNVQGETFKQMDVDVMLFLNEAGEVVLKASFSRKDGSAIPFPVGMEERLQPGSVLLRPHESDAPVSGVLDLPDGPVMVAARPVLTSEYTGPARGTMVMAKLMDDDVVRQLSETTHLDLALTRVDGAKLAPEEQAALNSLLLDVTPHIAELSDSIVAGHGLVRDMFGNPALLISVDLQRTIYAQGQNSVAYFLLALGVIGLVTLLSTAILLERLVLRRVSRLSAEVSAVGELSDLSMRVSSAGKDELGRLAVVVNNTLDALDQSQARLRISEARHRAVVEAVPDAMLTFTAEGRVLSAKPDRENRLGGICVSLVGQRLADRLPPDLASAAEAGASRARATGHAETFDFRLRPDDAGEDRDYEARIVASGSDEVLAIIRDVTERKHLEDAHRKELLLREIHHRVKNNLQVISSLLSLQSDSMSDPRGAEVLRESQNRVRTMALIHEKLYKSRDMDGVDFGEYLRDLVAFLTVSYRLGRSDTSVEVDAPELELGLEKAVPCGLIVNELVSNALKYAFPDGRGGTVRVGLARQPDGNVELSVRDDGIGLPKGFDIYSTDSLGMRLVSSLADQMDASLEIQNGCGTSFTLGFAAK